MLIDEEILGGDAPNYAFEGKDSGNRLAFGA
jgi:hypothetical protein